MRSFPKLRGKLRELDINEQYLGELMGMSGASISRRMTGEQAWSLGEMYRVLEIINEPPRKLHLYFPPNWNQTQITNKRLRILAKEGVANGG